MSALICSISGNPLVHGVICTKTGYLFEKSTILKQTTVYGVCPHTNQPISQQDFVQLNATNPTVTQGFADPAKLIEKVKSQYEQLVLQTYYIKKTLTQTRQELAHALYKHDASIRVISKLQEEVNNNRNEIASLISKISMIENS